MWAGVVAEQSLLSLSLEISVAIFEPVVATDETASGSVVFATLVDDPASVEDIVDAYSGEIMLEVAGADEAVEAGLIYVADIDEGITAVELYSGAVPAVFTDAVAETATAVSTQDATLAGATATTALVANELSVVFVTPSPNSVSFSGSTLLTVQ